MPNDGLNTPLIRLPKFKANSKKMLSQCEQLQATPPSLAYTGTTDWISTHDRVPGLI